MKVLISVGLGYADLENRLPCGPETVFRIASISKSITMTMVARLWENGVLDLDKPIQVYVPTFPEKTFDSKKVRLIRLQLINMSSIFWFLIGSNTNQAVQLQKLKCDF